MVRMLSRRNLLQASLGGVAALSGGALGLGSLAPRAAFARAPKSALRTTRLADNLLLIEGARGNVVAAQSSDAVLLVDGGVAERSSDLLQAVAAETGKRRITTLFNTHWHWDHTGSNEALAKSTTTIIAHENTKLWLGAEVLSKWENRTYAPRPASALPTQTFFYDAKPLSFGTETVQYGLMPQAHTDGDIYVFFPSQNVLVAGDVVSGGGYPVVDYCTNGWSGGMINGLKSLIKLCDANTRIVPGSGPLRTRADLDAQLDLCFTVLQKISESYYKGHTWEELVASQPTKDFDSRWGNPERFLRNSYEGAWLHINEIRRVTR
jgi:glyoxylase-like metal-dependent hydrolase (beta-lactamase superfamily II)